METFWKYYPELGEYLNLYQKLVATYEYLNKMARCMDEKSSFKETNAFPGTDTSMFYIGKLLRLI